MEFRSTTYGFASPKDIQSNVGSSHGVQLAGGSTGATVTAAGDDDNITLKVSGKGTGAVVIGSSVSVLQFTVNSGPGSTSAAAALGNVTSGSSGPGTQAQTGWIQIKESSGGTAWIPYWK